MVWTEFLAMTAVTGFLHKIWDRSPELVFDLVRPADIEEVAIFLLKDYFPHLPLTEITEMSVELEIRPWIGKYLASVVQKNVSVLVRDTSRNKTIVAVCINDITYRYSARDDINLFSFTDPVVSPNWTKICQLVKDLYTDIHFDEDPILSFNLVGVAPGYSHRGLATKLIQIIEEIAKGRRIHLMKNEVVNEYLANTYFEAGYVMAKEIKYEFYGKEGEIPERSFFTNSIHNNIRLMVKKIAN